jgi:hypothetical protein
MQPSTSLRKEEGNIGFFVIVAAVIIGLFAFVIYQQDFLRIQEEVPVDVNVRTEIDRIGNVVQIQNNSNTPLTDVVVTGKNPARHESATYRIGNLGAGEQAEVETRNWNWIVAPNETITISANGYFPLVVSSDQLGIR